MSIVIANGITKSFHENKVLDGVSFTVKPGTFTALLGKNGSGKSTILNILMGEIQMDEGECLLFGKSIRNNPDELKNKIGHVSEKIKLDYPLNVDQFIPHYARFFKDYDLDSFFKHAKELKLNLRKQFGEYSRGQKMQIVLLAALCQRPELLLIDEITSVLDAYARNYVINLLKDFTASGGTVVLTTNIVNEVQYYCTDVMFLSKSKVKFQTPLKEIPANFRKVRSFDQSHAIFNDPACIWSGGNSDGSQSYIIPHGRFSSAELTGLLEDKRAVTLEDLYIYHSQRDSDD